MHIFKIIELLLILKMGKKNTGGKNFKKQKNSNSTKDRELIFREDSQSYARIIKMLGDGRFECECFEPQINDNFS